VHREAMNATFFMAWKVGVGMHAALLVLLSAPSPPARLRRGPNPFMRGTAKMAPATGPQPMRHEKRRGRRWCGRWCAVMCGVRYR